MTLKKVTKRYASKEFNTVGLVLIIYCIFVLFFPLLINALLQLYIDPSMYQGQDLELIIRVVLTIIGTFLPFSLLKLSSRKYMPAKQKKIKASSKQIVCLALVFFTVASAAIFSTNAIAAFFGISGKLVGGVGISIDSTRITSVLYIISFIVITPFLEEYAFRGVLITVLSKYGKHFALYASALIFSMAHGSFMEFFPSFIMGLLLGKIALRYKRIGPTVWIHMIFNLLLYLSFVVPESFSSAVTLFYGVLYILSIALVFTGTYTRITVNKSSSNSEVTKLFLKTFTVSVSLVLFVISSILTIILK